MRIKEHVTQCKVWLFYVFYYYFWTTMEFHGIEEEDVLGSLGYTHKRKKSNIRGMLEKNLFWADMFRGVLL